MTGNPLLHAPADTTTATHQRIGELLCESGVLTEHDVRRVIAHQRKKGMRFGEAARSLRLVKEDDIQRALARQFNYTYIKRGECGLNPMLVSAYQPFDPPAETFRVLRSQLALRWFDRGNKVLAIGGARAGAGASTLAANLAVSFAQVGERTLLLDANFRHPTQHLLFGISAEIGLADVLIGRCTLHEATMSIGPLNDLAVLCAGPAAPNPHELLSGPGLRYVLGLAHESFDVVIFDTAPVLEYADATIVAARAGGYLFVARRNVTRLADIEAAKARLAPTGAAVLGAAIND